MPNPYEPPDTGLIENSPVVASSKTWLLTFLIFFILTLFIPVIEFRQINFVHHLPWLLAYIGLATEYWLTAIRYIMLHLALCAALTVLAVNFWHSEHFLPKSKNE